MPPARIVLKALILALAAACGLAATAAQGGRWSPHLDVLTHFAPVYLAGAVVMLATAIFVPGSRYRLALAVLGALAAACSIGLILPEFLAPASPPAQADASGRLKVIQFNANTMPRGPTAAIDWIVGEKPDAVVIVQGTPTLLRAVRDRAGLQLICGTGCEVAILGRARTSQPFHAPRGTPAHVALYEYQDAQGPFVIAGVHHTWPTQTLLHRQNSDELVRALRKRPSDRLILLGDFNSTPWSFARRREDRALGIERRTRGLYSWPAGRFPGFPFLPIDHVYAGPAWRTVEVRRGPNLGSDHYPVVVTLAPKR